MTNRILEQVGIASANEMRNTKVLNLLDKLGLKFNKNQRALYLKITPKMTNRTVIVANGITLFLSTITERILFKGSSRSNLLLQFFIRSIIIRELNSIEALLPMTLQNISSLDRALAPSH